MDNLKNNILKTLLYYDIFRHPLKSDEIFSLLPQNSVTKKDISNVLKQISKENQNVNSKDDYYFIGKNENYIELRRSREMYSKKSWKTARFITHIIKRFPFVRAVFVTGSLSKNSSIPDSDLDFMVVTEKNRLWISRTLLMLFKKILLFNSHKYFCINYFVSEDSLVISEKNIFIATEIAHIKSTFNSGMMFKFLEANSWIKEFFPNYRIGDPYFNSSGFKVNNRKSYFQSIAEIIFMGKTGDKLDVYFREKTIKHWNKKYSNYDKEERERLFTSTSGVSKTHPGNMQKVILNNYRERLKRFNLEWNE
ncbi:MAG: nucleotidyltransferase domain-containing protein [Ignavibacteria bacterium]|nr:nucleotidyltransferase domain-containing protein [Ignavibacteria bacterium]